MFFSYRFYRRNATLVVAEYCFGCEPEESVNPYCTERGSDLYQNVFTATSSSFTF